MKLEVYLVDFGLVEMTITMLAWFHKTLTNFVFIRKFILHFFSFLIISISCFMNSSLNQSCDPASSLVN